MRDAIDLRPLPDDAELMAAYVKADRDLEDMGAPAGIRKELPKVFAFFAEEPSADHVTFRGAPFFPTQPLAIYRSGTVLVGWACAEAGR